MNSTPFISHHLFVSAAGHENRPQSRAGRSPSRSKAVAGRRTKHEAPTKRVEETEAPQQWNCWRGWVQAK